MGQAQNTKHDDECYRTRDRREIFVLARLAIGAGNFGDCDVEARKAKGSCCRLLSTCFLEAAKALRLPMWSREVCATTNTTGIATDLQAKLRP